MSSPRAPQFDSHADDYDAELMQGLELSGESKEFFARGRIRSLRQWWEGRGRPEPRRIVDYGCGTGQGAALLAEAFPEATVLGVDPSGECVERARHLHAAERVRFATLHGAYELEHVDLVHLNGVVHHVEPRERSRLFAALRRLVAPRGVVALFENNPLNVGTRLVMARIPFDRDAVPVMPWEARRRLGEVALRTVETRYLFFFPRPLRVLRPLERFLLRVPLGAQYGVFAVAPEASAGRERLPA